MNDATKKERIAPQVLIAVDGSRESLHAVSYAHHVTRLVPDLKFVLLNVMPQTPPMYTAEARTDAHALARVKKIEAANHQKARESLEKAKDHLLKHDVDPDRIETRIQPRRSGLAKDILNELESGRYDALVVGRRGLTRTQELFLGSVTNQLMQHAVNAPLWIVSGQITKPKVLVAVDGSEASLRAVDHVAFMLGDNPEAEVDFLHVTPKLQNYCAIDFENQDQVWRDVQDDLDEAEVDFRRQDDQCMEDFLKQAVRVLSEAGFSRDRIKVEEREISAGVGRTIIRTAKEGGYGTIVMGRRGLGKSFFLGSVSDKVIRSVSDMAVWLVN
jgi:nucleotide-binding universal stress UspA family protein